MDDKDYVEPQKSIAGLLYWQFGLLMILIFLLVIGICLWYLRMREHKASEEQGEYQNLIEMINMDRDSFIAVNTRRDINDTTTLD